MRRTLAFFLSLLALSSLAACSLPLSGKSSAAIPTPGAGWLMYTNNAYGFQMQYPPGASIGSGATDTFISFGLPVAPGTNLMENRLDINLQIGSPTCRSLIAMNFVNVTTTNRVINGLNWVEENAEMHGADVSQALDAYSTSNGFVCVTLNFRLDAQNPAAPSTVPPAYERTAESQVFVQIVNTFKWLSGGAVTPTP